MPNYVIRNIFLGVIGYFLLLTLLGWSFGFCGAFSGLLLGLVFLDMIWPSFSLFGDLFFKGSRKTPTVAFTFDDGPDPRHTPQVLEILRKWGVKATFFVLGEKAQQYPNLIQEMIKDGHEIGCHGYDHTRFIFKTPSYIRNSLLKWQEATGIFPSKENQLWFRTSHGQKNIFVPWVAKKMGYRLVSWTRGVWDTDQPGVEKIVGRSTKNLQPGEILLLHDGGPKNESRMQTVQALPRILEFLTSRGLQAVTLSELAKTSSSHFFVRRILLGFLVSGFTLGYLFRSADWKELQHHFFQISTPWLMLALGVDFLCLVTKSQVWQTFVQKLCSISRWRAVGIYLIGSMINAFIPFRAGDFGRSHFLKKDQEVGHILGLSSIGLESLVHASALLCLVALLSFVELPKDPILSLMGRLGVFLSIAFLLIIFFRNKFRKFWSSSFASLFQPFVLLKAFLWAMVAWSFNLTCVAFLLHAYGIHVSILAAPTLTFLLGASMFLPSGPARLGVFEAAVVLGLSFFEVSENKALGFAFVLHLAQTIPILLYGSLAWALRRS